jgi:hypothetical protein
MSIAFDEQRTERTDDARIRSVDLIQYRELLVSRRKLERVRGRPGWLRDRESDETFVFAKLSDASVAQSV